MARSPADPLSIPRDSHQPLEQQDAFDNREDVDGPDAFDTLQPTGLDNEVNTWHRAFSREGLSNVQRGMQSPDTYDTINPSFIFTGAIFQVVNYLAVSSLVKSGHSHNESSRISSMWELALLCGPVFCTVAVVLHHYRLPLLRAWTWQLASQRPANEQNLYTGFAGAIVVPWSLFGLGCLASSLSAVLRTYDAGQNWLAFFLFLLLLLLVFYWVFGTFAMFLSAQERVRGRY
ncbi:hypothetical protein SISNIDRAFT_495947 [Sistotremastrum niveocremeum HHB9708]|uniref:Uncharacterized protein n=1 Tax=Sistotremastrum niveocremeum HHB9708 TaxID=1314777 RepID=A0A164TZ99_9AGAM|nr:hypothetical protein SISNIDRAFT_495947 [Sistotremastrum niveocremeum HHB9708]